MLNLRNDIMSPKTKLNRDSPKSPPRLYNGMTHSKYTKRELYLQNYIPTLTTLTAYIQFFLSETFVNDFFIREDQAIGGEWIDFAEDFLTCFQKANLTAVTKSDLIHGIGAFYELSAGLSLKDIVYANDFHDMTSDFETMVATLTDYIKVSSSTDEFNTLAKKIALFGKLDPRGLPPVLRRKAIARGLTPEENFH